MIYFRVLNKTMRRKQVISYVTCLGHYLYSLKDKTFSDLAHFREAPRYIYGLVQDCSNFIANELQLL